MILRFDPASSDRMVWMVSVPRASGAVPVDFTTVTDEQRAFLGEAGAFVDAEPVADGWEIKDLSQGLGSPASPHGPAELVEPLLEVTELPKA